MWRTRLLISKRRNDILLYDGFKNCSHLHPFDFDAPRGGGIIQIGLKVTRKGYKIDLHFNSLHFNAPGSGGLIQNYL